MERVRKEQRLERELVARAQRGDVDAFAELVRDTADSLHNVAYRILRDADAADDATQRALIAAWDHLADLRNPDKWQSWTYRLVVNAAYREARRERSQHASVRFVRIGSAVATDANAQVADRDEMERAFRQLSPEHRAVLVLHYYVDLPLAEIAESVGVPVGTVGSRLHLATRKLRAALEADAETAYAGGHVA